jgi:hypothetical protein
VSLACGIAKETAQSPAALIGPLLASDVGMSVVQLIRRLRDEFTAMPGLCLTGAQVQRLCTADAPTAMSALRALVSAGFLTATHEGAYMRSDIFKQRSLSGRAAVA